MKIKQLTFFNDYKQFKKDDSFSFSSKVDSGSHFENLYVSVLVGRNGSGKTTLMSLISSFFHNIERYGSKIPADFEIVYSTNWTLKEVEVCIKHFNNLITFSVEGIYDQIQLLPKKNAREEHFSLINMDKPYITYENIREYLPFKVVTSTFSIHGEYPISRPSNYIGDEIVDVQSITDIYGNNHYDLGSISLGIFRFVNLYFKKSNELKELLDLFDLKFTNRVLFRDSDWETVKKKWLRLSESSFIKKYDYLNDIEFERNGRLISLGNMSSGEKMLLLRSLSILNAVEQDSIIIIEEPELHLDPVWNRQLTTLFEVLLSGYNSHLLIATHNYSIINSVQQSNIIYLDNGSENKISENTFLASYEELFRILYGEDFRSNKIEEDFLSTLSEKSVDELKIDYEKIGNSIYKYLIYKKIREKS
ncbi:ATP-binding protein [uncultured Algibacter sp.]|uniref:ATP-binding protein n=1 Tax=uncultured Algibacter sp. TaxID=298659 RepID=UPI002604B9CD|nr:ATP-binding protein [uncultured Algibacter sp.]